MKGVYFRILENSDQVIASMAWIASVLSIIFGIVALHIQRKQCQKSILPIYINSLADFNNCFRIKISNSGFSPIILNLCEKKGISISKLYPIDCMLEGITWKNSRKNIEGHAKIAGELLNLVELNINWNSKYLYKNGIEFVRY